MPTLRVILFAAAADAVGASDIEIKADEGVQVGELLDRLTAAHPSAEAVLKRAAVAVNERYAHPSMVLRQSDTIAIIPPVSGG